MVEKYTSGKLTSGMRDVEMRRKQETDMVVVEDPRITETHGRARAARILQSPKIRHTTERSISYLLDTSWPHHEKIIGERGPRTH